MMHKESSFGDSVKICHDTEARLDFTNQGLFGQLLLSTKSLDKPWFWLSVSAGQVLR